MDSSSGKKTRFSPSLCVTHNCNLNCVYCYQEHDIARMSLGTAKKAIDWIFDNVPENMSDIEIGFIGGEPLLEFDLIKKVVQYTCSKERAEKYIFYATTNGTLLTEEIKSWFSARKDCFVLGLSIDGTRETHNHNRSNSFDDIDIGFFVDTWPNQGVKMTLSEFSLHSFAKDIKYLHSIGFKEIGGVNLFEGSTDWSQNKYIEVLIPQLSELVEFYVDNDTLPLNQMFNKHLDFCEASVRSRRKWCGVGNGTNFFDVDGEMYPCPLVTKMTFSEEALNNIMAIDFTDDDQFVDEYCYDKCYLYPVCPTCYGANYLNCNAINKRDKRRCRIQKLISLFVADLQAKRIKKNPDSFDKNKLFHTIEAIKKIRSLYLSEFLEILPKS
jgi:sulfatase maturation enzyme AslB (radical SAM superfamily)